MLQNSHLHCFVASQAIAGPTPDQAAEPTPRPFLVLIQLLDRTLLLQAQLPVAPGLELSKSHQKVVAMQELLSL